MKRPLQILSAAIFVAMTAVTVRASLAVSLWDAWPAYRANPWALATLADAYSGFLTFYVWVLYKERTLGARVLWFLLIMGLGNIAVSLYLFLQLARLAPNLPAEAILRRRPA